MIMLARPLQTYVWSGLCTLFVMAKSDYLACWRPWDGLPAGLPPLFDGLPPLA